MDRSIPPRGRLPPVAMSATRLDSTPTIVKLCPGFPTSRNRGFAANFAASSSGVIALLAAVFFTRADELRAPEPILNF
jgi:hypothetical protein